MFSADICSLRVILTLFLPIFVLPLTGGWHLGRTPPPWRSVSPNFFRSGPLKFFFWNSLVRKFWTKTNKWTSFLPFCHQLKWRIHFLPFFPSFYLKIQVQSGQTPHPLTLGWPDTLARPPLRHQLIFEWPLNWRVIENKPAYLPYFLAKGQKHITFFFWLWK